MALENREPVFDTSVSEHHKRRRWRVIDERYPTLDDEWL